MHKFNSKYSETDKPKMILIFTPDAILSSIGLIPFILSKLLISYSFKGARKVFTASWLFIFKGLNNDFIITLQRLLWVWIVLIN